MKGINEFSLMLLSETILCLLLDMTISLPDSLPHCYTVKRTPARNKINGPAYFGTSSFSNCELNKLIFFIKYQVFFLLVSENRLVSLQEGKAVLRYICLRPCY